MRYNVTKTKLGFGFIKYLGKELTETEAITLLNEIHEEETCRMFQDVTEIQGFGDCQYFHVINNHVVYQYQIEEDMYWKLGQVINPKNAMLNDFCLN